MKLSIFILAIVCLSTVLASSGDHDTFFINCVRKCKCSPNTGLFSWSCLGILNYINSKENCRYECMHQISQLYLDRGEPIRQYYGKWPFYRFYALQEPASVVFSILNLFAHYCGLLKLRNLSRLAPMKENYTYIALSGIFACMCSTFNAGLGICSTIFHSKDLPLTEKLDYFSAMLYLLA